jgi:DNA polymerase-3 subunit beta
LTTKKNNEKIFVKCQKSNFNLAGQKPDDFHRVDIPDNIVMSEMLTEELLDVLKKVSFSTVLDPSRINLSGVFAEFLDDCARFTATDGRRAARMSCPNNTGLRFRGIIHYNGLKLLMVMLGQAGEKVSLGYSNKDFVFKFDNNYLFINNIKAQYPDLGKLLNTPTVETFMVNKQTFLEAIDRNGLLTGASNVIQLSFYDMNNHYIRAQFDGNASEERFELENESSTPMDLSQLHINYVFLRQAIEVCEGDVISLGFTSDRGPLFITDQTLPDYAAMVMPMMP